MIALIAIFAFTFVACEGPQGPRGYDGNTPELRGGYWYLNGTQKARAEFRQPTIVDGNWVVGGNVLGQATGNDGDIPEIIDGYWYVGGDPTGVRAEWIQPEIVGDNWVLGELVLGPARGPMGPPGEDAIFHYVEGLILGGRVTTYDGVHTLTIMEGQTALLTADTVPHNALIQTMLWDTSGTDTDVVGVRRVNREDVRSIWTGPASGLLLTARDIGETEITVIAMGAGNNAVEETVTVQVVPYVSSPWDYQADIVVVGVGAAGAMAALAPARVWPGVRVIALEADFQTQNSVSRSMGGGHGDSIPLNASARINFTPAGPVFNADGSVSVTWGNLTRSTQILGAPAFSPPGTPATIPYFGIIDPPVQVTRNGRTRNRFVATVNYLPKLDTVREAIAHSHWMRTVLLQELGIFGAGTGMMFPNDGAGGSLGGQARFDAAFRRADVRENVTLKLRTRGDEFIFENGPGSRILAVRASVLAADGSVIREITIGADKFILATGNFLRDADLVAEYAYVYTNHQNLRRFAEAGWITAGSATMNCGRGHIMARLAGAGSYPEQYFGFGNSYICESFTLRLSSNVSNDLQGVFKSRHFATPPQFTLDARSGGLIMVDGDGRRFVAEAGGLTYGMILGAGGPAIGPILLDHNNFPYFIIVSSDDHEDLVWNNNITWTFGGQTRTANVMTALNAAADLGGQVEVVRADTIEALAGLMGINAANFVETVNTYQAAVAAGTDLVASVGEREFTRAADTLVRRFRPEDGPFFAIRIYPSTAMGTGGVAADWRGRALGTWNNMNTQLENLYVVGEMSFRGVYQGGYPAGSGIGWSMARGMIAGMDAAFRLRWNTSVPSLQYGQ